MQFTHPFSRGDFEAAAKIPTTLQLAMDAHMYGVDACFRFMKEFLPPGLGDRKPATLRGTAVTDIYTAICGFLVCIYRLRGEWHVQGIAACSRSIFELYNDLLLLTLDQTEMSARRYHAFIEVEQLHKTRKRQQFFKAHPEFVEPRTLAGMEQFIARDGPTIDAEIEALWEQPPMHWSGIRSAETRARNAGLECEAMYFQFYSILSWFVHTAGVGTAGLTPEKLKGQVARALELVRQVVPSAFGIVATEIGVDISDLTAKLDFLRQVFFFRLVALKLGQPERFSFRTDRPN
jgi:hypothetical protein